MFVRLMQKNASLCGLFCHRLPGALPRKRLTRVGFQPGFFDCSPKNGECRENEIIKVGCLFTFLIGEWQILPLTDRKKSKQCPGKICRCSNSAFLHGVEWDRLIVHRTLSFTIKRQVTTHVLMTSLVCANAANSKHRLRCNDRGSKNKLKRPDNQGLISNLFKSSTQDKPFNPVSSQTMPGPESDKQPVTNVTESDSTQIVDRVWSSSEQSLPSTELRLVNLVLHWLLDKLIVVLIFNFYCLFVCLKLVYRLK